MTRPRDEMLEHEFDGIREYDNPPPRWIMAILYGSIVFGVCYWLYYQTYGVGHLPRRQYEAEMARAAEQQLARMATTELSDQTLLLMSQVPASVNEGRQIFQQFCAACHQTDGSGNIGPNLTDGYWLHGGRPMQILHTVTYGVPEKGMVAWGGQLGPARVQKVVSYVLTIKGTNRPGKAPQGVLESTEEVAPAKPAGTGAAPAGGTGSVPQP
jgi:cytochrome c oxidase cbb3-type subunit III